VPNREFLETYQLYRRFPVDLPKYVEDLPVPSIHMYCSVCDSGQTFNGRHEYQPRGAYVSPPSKQPLKVLVLLLDYRCASCNNFHRYFLVKLDSEGKYAMKVGQDPQFDIDLEPVLAKALGPNAAYFKKGRICELHSYGIGAFGYYRRIVEDIIDDLLNSISSLIADDGERDKYLKALEEVKKMKVAERKIELVKDLLPATLRPGGMNPLSTLYEVLSEGLHAESDERCIKLAEEVREVLVFLVGRIENVKTADKRYVESMRRLIERKRK